MRIPVPVFGDVYDGRLIKTFAREVERAFFRVKEKTEHRERTVTSDYTVTKEDVEALLDIDTSGGNVIITLPLSSDTMLEIEFEIHIRKINLGGGSLRIVTQGSDLILGVNEIRVLSQWTSMHIRAIEGGFAVI